MSACINTKEAAQTNSCGRIGLIFRFERFFFALLETKKQSNKYIYRLWKSMVLKRFLLILRPSILSPSFFSISTFSHTKSVIIAQETRNTVTMLFLQKHDNHRKLSSIFFCHLVTPQRQGGGGSIGWFVREGWGTLKPAIDPDWPAQRTHQSWSRSSFFLFFLFSFFKVCLRKGISSCEHLHCQVRSKERWGVLRQTVAPGGLHEDGGGRNNGPSSVVVLGKVQGAQVVEAQTHAFHVKSVDLPLLAFQQVFDAVGSLLLKGNQLLFNLQVTWEQEIFKVKCSLLISKIHLSALDDH